MDGRDLDPPPPSALSVRLSEILARADETPLEAFRAELEQIRDRVRELQGLVEHDALTDAYNRYGLARIGTEVMARRQRHGVPVSALFIDIDHLKDLNRAFGHVATDGLLRAAALRLRELSRPYDALVRWGGDEFVLLLPDVILSQAVVIADRIRSCVVAEPFTAADHTVEISVSIGVGDLHDGEEVADLVRRISELMYEAKSGGRNRIAVFKAEGERSSRSAGGSF